MTPGCESLPGASGGRVSRGPMRTALDAHVHLHPFYDLPRAFSTARARLAAAGGNGDGVLCLTEAAGCDAFGALRDGRWPVSGWTPVLAADGLALRLESSAAGSCLWVLAGRQIVARERVEILGLGLAAAIPGGLAVGDAVERVRDAGALPVLPWAPGKWLGGRGRVIASLMDRFGPGALLLADSSLRPLGYPTPILLRRAEREGFRVLAGSDPLPFPGEERRIGSYATVADGRLDPEAPARSILGLLGPGGPALAVAGRRPCPGVTILRLVRHARAKRATGRSAAG